MSFIGTREVKTVIGEAETDVVSVELVDGGKVLMKKHLLEELSSVEKGNGDIHDVVRYVFAKKYLKDMAEFGLDFMQVQQISQGISVLGQNLRDEAISQMFGVSSLLEIKVEDVFKALTKEEEEKPPEEQVKEG